MVESIFCITVSNETDAETGNLNVLRQRLHGHRTMNISEDWHTHCWTVCRSTYM